MLIIGGVGVVFLIGVFLVMSMLSKSIPSSTNSSAKSPVFPSVTPLSNANTTSFKSTEISFTTPAGKTVGEAPIAGGGKSVLINLSGEEHPEDVIEIQMTPSSLTPLQRIYDIMTGFGLKRTDVVIGADNIPAARFEGNVLLGGKIQQDVVVFEKNGLVYKIQMMYSADAVNPTYEAQLQQVLSNLKTQ